MFRLCFGLSPVLYHNNSMREQGFLKYKATLILVHSHVCKTELDMALAITGALLEAYLVIDSSMFNDIM